MFSLWYFVFVSLVNFPSCFPPYDHISHVTSNSPFSLQSQSLLSTSRFQSSCRYASRSTLLPIPSLSSPSTSPVFWLMLTSIPFTISINLTIYFRRHCTFHVQVPMHWKVNPTSCVQLDKAIPSNSASHRTPYALFAACTTPY